MIRIIKRLPFALLIASTLTAGACYGTVGYATPGADVYVESAPPEPRVEYYDTRPGYVWIGGRWNWNGGQWVWGPGRYERERAGQYWEGGRWEPSGGRYVWREGRWNAGHGPERREVREVGPGGRDHRTEPARREPERDPRDHRHP